MMTTSDRVEKASLTVLPRRYRGFSWQAARCSLRQAIGEPGDHASALHDRREIVGLRDGPHIVGEITAYDEQIRELAGLEAAQIVSESEQLGVGRRRCAQRIERCKPRLLLQLDLVTVVPPERGDRIRERIRAGADLHTHLDREPERLQMALEHRLGLALRVFGNARRVYDAVEKGERCDQERSLPFHFGARG